MKDKDKATQQIQRARVKYKDPALHAAALKKMKDHAIFSAEAEGRYLAPHMSPVEFLKDGLNKLDTIWPAVLPHYEILCSGQYVESVLTGGIGTAKTTLAVFTQLYETYRILNLSNPHREFGLDPDSEIVIVFQSLTEAAARSVDYEFFRSIMDSSPWFQDHEAANYNKELKSTIQFDRHLTIKPVSSLETAAIGQNVIGGIIDEINYLSVIQNSVKAVGGLDYDQAQVNYNAIARRRESRFMKQGFLAGMLCLVSSKRYPGQFTDRKVAQARTELAETGKTSIYVFDKRTWEVRPEGSYCGDKFKVYIGERNSNPFVIEPGKYGDYAEDDPKVDNVPIEYMNSYRDDIHAALRDISGKSVQLQHAYFNDLEKLGKAFGTHKSVFNIECADFFDKVLALRPKLFIGPKKLHYAHVDLGATADSAGICIGHVDAFIEVERTDGVKEMLPRIVIDGIVEVPPPRNGEINFAKIRTIFYRLRELGMNLKWISYDSWQSRDSLQILRNQKFIVGTLSLDKDTRGYDMLKRTVSDGRLYCPAHKKCEDELRLLQWERSKDKIDHPPTGSKDCADALAGVVFGLTMRREIWVNAGIPTPKVIPDEKPNEEEGI